MGLAERSVCLYGLPVFIVSSLLLFCGSTTQFLDAWSIIGQNFIEQCSSLHSTCVLHSIQLLDGILLDLSLKCVAAIIPRRFHGFHLSHGVFSRGVGCPVCLLHSLCVRAQV